jgi:hypothetical protein
VHLAGVELEALEGKVADAEATAAQQEVPFVDILVLVEILVATEV